MGELPRVRVSRCEPVSTDGRRGPTYNRLAIDAPSIHEGPESILLVSGHRFTTVPRGRLCPPQEHARALIRWLREQPRDYAEYVDTEPTFHLAASHEYAVERLAPILEGYRLMCLQFGWRSHGWKAVASHFNQLTAAPRVAGKRRPAKAYGGPSHNRYRIYHIPPLSQCADGGGYSEDIRRAA